MSAAYWRDLTVTTITDPAEAARRLMALSLSREALWLALALAIVINTAIQALSNMVLPVSNPEFAELGMSLVPYAGLVGGGLLLTIASLCYVGRAMGGTGSFDDIMVLMVWLQFLRAMVQVVMLVLLLAAPVLSALLIAVAFLLSLYITLHFINQAHRLNSIGRAVGVLLMSVVAVAVALLIFVALAGGPMTGAVPNV